MVSVLVCGLSGPGSSPDQGHFIMFLGKTLYSHSASLVNSQVHKWVPMKLMLGGNPTMELHPIQGGGGVERTPSHFMQPNREQL